jgi:hypothetical protein
MSILAEDIMVRFALHGVRRKGAAVAAVVGMGALIAACAPSTSARIGSASVGETAASAAPVSLACEPNQRAVVRQVVVNGVPQSQMECQSVAGSAFAPTGTSGSFGATTPAGYIPASYTQAPIADTRFVRTVSQPEVVTREVAPQRVVYQRAPERIVSRPKRSVKTSALIIGSSAAGGAGIGALIGGRKGAGIGALAGGGAAALWDQITRHR